MIKTKAQQRALAKIICALPKLERGPSVEQPDKYLLRVVNASSLPILYASSASLPQEVPEELSLLRKVRVLSWQISQGLVPYPVLQLKAGMQIESLSFVPGTRHQFSLFDNIHLQNPSLKRLKLSVVDCFTEPTLMAQFMQQLEKLAREPGTGLNHIIFRFDADVRFTSAEYRLEIPFYTAIQKASNIYPGKPGIPIEYEIMRDSISTSFTHADAWGSWHINRLEYKCSDETLSFLDALAKVSPRLSFLTIAMNQPIRDFDVVSHLDLSHHSFPQSENTNGVGREIRAFPMLMRTGAALDDYSHICSALHPRG